ncbi:MULTISPECIES: helix-turn-helix domain-containing protein [unclassified Streptomyces]|uniref:helix-turn-helix domain-containing protein n=1 Tax=unclassified Streptomyces TaxID=2593676 RepID=UPI001F0370C7|nr:MULTISPECIES: helix-turn-helix transcriptional regulator [unclassified Streptomyces]MCH0566606.1 helix-turn-helix transcriptional regulator [Streptomyces sp. MUM 2J]MCH0572156.1 helix-turn-helix transcriptional regulator [Streptomyces sp. MUM 136J]
MSSRTPDGARAVPLRIPGARPGHPPEDGPAARPEDRPAGREPLWRDLVGDILRRERLAQERTLKEVAEAAKISMPYLSEVERGRKEASSEVLAAAAHALGLGLGDLLARAHTQLTRPVRRGHPRAATTSFDGLCLAA